MILRFLHGWGLDARLWDGVAALLPEHACELEDRGYFGQRSPPSRGRQEDAESTLTIAHSFGTMLALQQPPALGLIAINGFDCFTARGSFPGVPPRVVDRMLTRFADDPTAVLADFRQRCGEEQPFAEIDSQRLGEDLQALRDGDCRAEAARFGHPILSLQGEDDPILPPALRDAAFASAGQVERMSHPGGHLLPLTDPAFCATAIRAFAERLA